jgi:hypothetical protein
MLSCAPPEAGFVLVVEAMRGIVCGLWEMHQEESVEENVCNQG